MAAEPMTRTIDDVLKDQLVKQTADLPGRLRVFAKIEGAAHSPRVSDVGQALWEAADEIERLSSRVGSLEGMLATAHDPRDIYYVCGACGRTAISFDKPGYGPPTTIKMREAIRIGCMASDVHLTCSYPDCTCKVVPAAVRAAVAFAIRDAVKVVRRG